MEEGRRLAKRAMARTRLMYAGALRRARTAATRAATVLGPWREPIIRGAARVGTGVQRLLGRIRRRHALIVAGSFAVLLALIVGYSIATLPLDGGLQVDPTPSALVVEADDGETFATRGVFKGTKVTAADVPRPPRPGRRGDRGPPVLQPPRRRSMGHPAGRLAQLAGRRHARGRQHHHPAARAPDVPVARPEPAPQGPGGRHFPLAGAASSARRRSSCAT